VTDVERNSPAGAQNARAIDDTDLDQVVGGEIATPGSAGATTTTSTSDILITKKMDHASPKLLL
jgi:type VI protein secretion system component Hcp